MGEGEPMHKWCIMATRNAGTRKESGARQRGQGQRFIQQGPDQLCYESSPFVELAMVLVDRRVPNLEKNPAPS